MANPLAKKWRYSSKTWKKAIVKRLNDLVTYQNALVTGRETVTDCEAEASRPCCGFQWEAHPDARSPNGFGFPL